MNWGRHNSLPRFCFIHTGFQSIASPQRLWPSRWYRWVVERCACRMITLLTISIGVPIWRRRWPHAVASHEDGDGCRPNCLPFAPLSWQHYSWSGKALFWSGAWFFDVFLQPVSYLLRNENNFGFFAALGAGQVDLPILNVHWSDFKTSPLSFHPGHQLQHDSVPRLHGAENDLIHHVLFDIFHCWGVRSRNILRNMAVSHGFECRDRLNSWEVEKGLETGIPVALGGGLAAVESPVRKDRTSSVVMDSTMPVTEHLLEPGEDELIVLERIFFRVLRWYSRNDWIACDTFIGTSWLIGWRWMVSMLGSRISYQRCKIFGIQIGCGSGTLCPSLIMLPESNTTALFFH